VSPLGVLFFFSSEMRPCVSSVDIAVFRLVVLKSAKASGSQSGRYRPPGVNWTIQGVDK